MKLCKQHYVIGTGKLGTLSSFVTVVYQICSKRYYIDMDNGQNTGGKWEWAKFENLGKWINRESMYVV